jgi:type IV pilus assembly protein PilA
MLTSVVKRLNEKRECELEGEAADAGFTLIELMVVLLIMAILLAIAIPTFLGVKGGAQDRAAQSNLNTALTNAKAIYGNNQSYGTSASAQASLSSSEASLTFVSATATPPATNPQNTISVGTDTTGNAIALVTKSQGGDCWGVFTSEATTVGNLAGTAWTSTSPVAGTYYSSWKPTTATCNAASAIGNSSVTWTQNSFPSAA